MRVAVLDWPSVSSPGRNADKPQGLECPMLVGFQINADFHRLPLSLPLIEPNSELFDLFTPRGHFNVHLSVVLCQ